MRTVRRGRIPSFAISRAASHVTMQPTPSSDAPVPTSHESMWPPSSTISCGARGRESRRRRWPTRRRLRSAPPSIRRTRTGTLRARRRAMRSASSADTDAAGIGVTPWPYCRLPVCGGPQAGRPDAAHERGDRAQLRRGARAAGAVGHRVAVGRERRVEQHDASFDLGGVRAQIVEAVDDDDLGLEAVRRRADRTAKTQDRQRMPRRADDLGALAAAHPARHHHRLGAHVLEAVALHRLGGPGDRAFEILGSAQPVAVRVGQLRQAAPGEVVGGRRVDQTGARVAIGIEPRHAGGTCV